MRTTIASRIKIVKAEFAATAPAAKFAWKTVPENPLALVTPAILAQAAKSVNVPMALVTTARRAPVASVRKMAFGVVRSAIFATAMAPPALPLMR